MNVVVIASEAVPFAKTGGLADVIGALPRILERLGHTVSLVLPCYRRSWEAAGTPCATGLTLRIPVGSATIEGHVYSTHLPGSNVSVYLIDQPGYFDREHLYQVGGRDYPDNCERFVFFARAALETAGRLSLRPDVLHCNDWQTGLIPAYLGEYAERHPDLAKAGTLLTVHNLAYQGVFPRETIALTDLGRRLAQAGPFGPDEPLNFLKTGLVFADMLNTVSPTYAQEIQTPAHGHGLDEVIRARRHDLRGILNGIDVAMWSPQLEPVLAAQYDAQTVEAGKAACKAQLQRRASLPERSDVPLFAQIGRLDPQKGWDLLAEVADDLLRDDAQLVVLGEGLPRYHERLDRLAAKYPGKVRAFLKFSSTLAHQIEAGADLFLMPSLYEPCGLNQMYSLVHGTVPIVRATGGLADTVRDVTPETLADGTATGFVFEEPTAEAFRAAIGRALALWPDRPAWSRLVRTGMRGDWSWERSARLYGELYQEVRDRAIVNAERRERIGAGV